MNEEAEVETCGAVKINPAYYSGILKGVRKE